MKIEDLKQCEFTPTYTYEEVYHPTRYNKGSIEVWDFIVDQQLDFLEGSAIKYICRHSAKNGVQDLEKAIEYIKKIAKVHYNKDI